MTTGFRLRDTDRGFRALMRRVRSHGAHRLVVGVLDRAGGAQQDGSDETILMIAIVQEFGGGDVPERSFIRAWADTHRAENIARVRRVAKAVLKGASAEVEFGIVGREMVAEIRAFMAAGIAPPLRARSAEKKGDFTPLVGGQLERAIEAEVRS